MIRHSTAFLFGFLFAATVGIAGASALSSQQLGSSWKTACTRSDGTVSTVCCRDKANECLADCEDLSGLARTQCDNRCTGAWHACKAARTLGGGSTIFQTMPKLLLQTTP
jgi:hypothetical protein